MTRIASSYRVIRPIGKTRFKWANKMASRDEKISLPESNTILQQATIDPEQAKNYLWFLDLEMIIARDPTRGFWWNLVILELYGVSWDPESIRSGKNLWPENEVDQGFRKINNFEKVENFEEHMRNSYSNQCFRGLGVV